ncbi:MAG TPA: GNAT family N-acetyltransferase [Candidatus Saccharimonadales bacterium]|nr:GNAT family N-acetyltransferase [Candidatus Saccharimonadales bacterium]
MNVRFATSNDKAQVFKLLDEFSSLLKTVDIPSKVGEHIFDEVISRNDTKIFVVEENNQLLGLATFYLLPNIRHGWKRGHIEDFFVTNNSRSKGLGTFLFSSIKDYCRKNNIKVIKLDSGNELITAHSFYKKNGGKTTEKFFRFDIE